jgi:microcystin-dependent protein
MSYVGVDHMGWMLCDGRSLSRDTYGLLFGVIGTTFGSEDGSTFKLPDFRGMIPGMAGQPQYSNASNNVNPTTYAIGDRDGEQRHKLTVDEMPTHNHGTQTDLSGAPPELYNLTSTEGLHNHTGTTDISGVHNHGGNTGSGGYAASSHQVAVSATTTGTADDTGNHTHPIEPDGAHAHPFTTTSNGSHAHYLNNTGGSNWHTNMQPTLFAGNMFMYSGKNAQAYFPYTWVGGVPASDGTAANPNVVSIY